MRTINHLLLVVLFVSAVSVPQANAQSSLTGAWRGQVERNGYTWDIWVHVEQSNARYDVKVSFPDWGMFLLETDTVAVNGDQFSFSTTWINSRFEGQVSEDYLEGVWSFSRGNAVARLYRSSERSGILRTEPVTVVVDDGARLEGMLILPEGEPPYAGMVLTHGSGRDTRRTGPYVSKANLAGMNGMAVLVYDKRGAGASTGGEREHMPGRLAADAKTMLEYLRSDPRIDPRRIGIGGASQGAWLAAEVAAGDPNIAFVFTVATPGLPASEQNVYSMGTRLSAQGMAQEEIQSAKKALRALYDFYRTGSAATRETAVILITASDAGWSNNEIFRRLMFAPDGAVYEEVDAGAWSSMFVDPLTWWREITVPVVSFWGEEDINLPATYSRNVIEAALREAGNSNYEFHVYPNAGHGVALENLPEGAWPRMAPGYVSTMAIWFADRAQRPVYIPD